MPDTPQVTVRTTEAGRVTEVVVPTYGDLLEWSRVARVVWVQIPAAVVNFKVGWGLSIRQPNGPDVVALAGETLRIAAGRVERMREDERHDTD